MFIHLACEKEKPHFLPWRLRVVKVKQFEFCFVLFIRLCKVREQIRKPNPWPFPHRLHNHIIWRVHTLLSPGSSFPQWLMSLF